MTVSYLAVLKGSIDTQHVLQEDKVQAIEGNVSLCNHPQTRHLNLTLSIIRMAGLKACLYIATLPPSYLTLSIIRMAGLKACLYIATLPPIYLTLSIIRMAGLKACLYIATLPPICLPLAFLPSSLSHPYIFLSN